MERQEIINGLVEILRTVRTVNQEKLNSVTEETDFISDLKNKIIDDKNNPDANKKFKVLEYSNGNWNSHKDGIKKNRTVGSLYDLIEAENLNEQRSKRPVHPERWHRARIIVNNGHVEHWLDNIKVLEYNRFSQMFRALVEYSKYSKWENFGQLKSGHILLQDHGDRVSFKNIKIRENEYDDRAALLYLNEDYTGGELFFPLQNWEYKPKPGTLIFFKGDHTIPHGVKKVESGERVNMISFLYNEKDKLRPRTRPMYESEMEITEEMVVESAQKGISSDNMSGQNKPWYAEERPV